MREIVNNLQRLRVGKIEDIGRGKGERTRLKKERLEVVDVEEKLLGAHFVDPLQTKKHVHVIGKEGLKKKMKGERERKGRWECQF